MKNLNEFEQWLKLQNKAEGTIKHYLYRLRKIPDDPEKQREFLVDNRKNYIVMLAWRSYLKFQKGKGEITTEELYSALETYRLPKRSKNSHEKKGKAYPKDQWPRLIQKAPHKQAKMGIWLGLQFGLRLSEITHLRIEDINFGEKIIHIREHKSNAQIKQVAWNPKHFHERDVPMNEAQAEILKRWIHDRPRNLGHSYLIWSPHFNASPGFVSSTTFERWCKKADPQLSPHDLRRSYATNLYYASDKDIKIVQLALGHTNVAITSDYLRLGEEEYMDKIREAMKV